MYTGGVDGAYTIAAPPTPHYLPTKYHVVLLLHLLVDACPFDPTTAAETARNGSTGRILKRPSRPRIFQNLYPLNGPAHHPPSHSLPPPLSAPSPPLAVGSFALLLGRVIYISRG